MFDDLIKKYKINEVVENQVGHSGDGVYYLKSDEQNYYLKVSKNSEIINEAKAYRYLAGKINVPQVYEFYEADGQYTLLMSEVKGKMLCDLLETDLIGTIKQYAEALKMIHQLPCDDYPIDRHLDDMIEKARKVMPEIDITTLEEVTKKRGLQATFDRLVAYKPTDRDLVICHGDFCMPNIIVGDTIGFIDLGRSGIDDRYQDIALALRSLKMNIELIGASYKDEYQTLFLETYGIEEIDENKREFYFLLDEFY